MAATEITIIGAGPVGALMSIFLARRGFPVTTHESRPDMRRVDSPAGRSINLALANRGIHALEQVGLMDVVSPHLIPMRGRMIHQEDGKQELQPYGNKPEEVIYSVSRGELNKALMDAAEGSGVVIRFNERCESLDPAARELVLVDEADVATVEVGQRVEIVAIAYPDQPMQGIVRYIANTAKIAPGRQGLSFPVKIDIIDAGEVILRPGMSSRAEIFTRQDREVIAVPIQAIIFEEDRSELRSEYFIFINDNGVARKTKVEVGLSDDEYQELTSSIDSNIEVIVGPDRELRHLLEGDRVDITRVEL